MERDFLPKVASIFYCEHCEYNTSKKNDYEKHKLTLKHKFNEEKAFLEINGNIKNASNVALYNCRICNFNSKNKNNYEKHLLTDKHRKNIIGEQTVLKYNCLQCNKEYLNYSGLWKHKKHCVVITEREPEPLNNTFTPNITSELFFEVLKESKELQNVLMEQNKELQNKLLEKENQLLEQNKDLQNKLLELASKQTTNINTQNNNQQFNLQFFLNETCKDAMNLVDFVNSLKLTIEDFETTGRLGFVDGISRIIIKELKKLNTEKLPIHCTDLKRETVYIKNNNIWEKENDEKHRLKWTIDRIADLNLNQHHEWQAKYPQCRENNTPENHKFVELTSVALGGRGKEQEDKYRDKIMRNVIKEVVLDKKSNVLK
jgi:hypothetical protein